jgi:hypothetical protein
MTVLGLINFMIFQWFFVRIGRRYRPTSTEILLDGTDNTNLERAGWGLLKWVVPLTGWWSDYVWIVGWRVWRKKTS